ncbi:hypothetical protein ACTXT7_006403 [Hymenolepis weldensis]
MAKKRARNVASVGLPKFLLRPQHYSSPSLQCDYRLFQVYIVRPAQLIRHKYQFTVLKAINFSTKLNFLPPSPSSSSTELAKSLMLEGQNFN